MRAIRPAVAASLSAAALLLAACGGGGSSSSGDTGNNPPPPVVYVGTGEGVFGGSFFNPTTPEQNSQILIMLPGGTYWSMYGNRAPSDGSLVLLGFMQGTGARDTANTKFLGTDGLNFNGRVPGTEVSIDAGFSSDGASAKGNITPKAGGAAANFTGTTQALAPYQYATPAAASAVTGDWTMQKLAGEPGVAHVNADGSFSLTGSNGCTVTGTITPHTSGKNLYTVNVNMGPSPCPNASSVQSGVGLLLPLAGGKTQFLTATLSADRSAWAFGTAVR